MEKVAGGWKRLDNEELHNLNASLNVIRVMKWRRMGCSMKETGNAYKVLG
jgi:hypothetical protein